LAFRIVYVHVTFVLCWSIGCDSCDGEPAIAGILHRHGGRAMAGNGGEKELTRKSGATDDALVAR